MAPVPPFAVLAAFGLEGNPVPLKGGQEESVRVGDAVLKPAHDAEEAEWLGLVLTGLPTSAGFRLARPLRSRTEHFVVQGWQACGWVAGEVTRGGRFAEVLRAGRAFHAALRGIRPHPALMRRTHRWALADRVAFGEASFDPLPAMRPLADVLLPASGPVSDPPSLVHGDLAGNVLVARGLPPAIIDVSPYFRPEAFAEAIVVVDAWLWYGEGPDLARWLEGREPSAYLARALLFRLVALNEYARLEPHGLEELPLFYRVLPWLKG